MYNYKAILGKEENNLTGITNGPSDCLPVAKFHFPILDNIYQWYIFLYICICMYIHAFTNSL